MTKIKRRFFAAAFAAVLLLTSLFTVDMSIVFAATSGSCGQNATWSYNTSTKTLTISGTGATKDYRDTTSKLLGTEKAPWADYKPAITTVVVGEGITEIGDYAFFECTALTSVSLPSTLTKLDGWGGAVGNVDKTYGCFQTCTALENITLPNSLIEIEPYVFNGCTALKKIVIPNNCTTIGKYAFFECTSLDKVTFGNSVTTLGENAFRNAGISKVDWNDKLTTISKEAFLGCHFTLLTLPETVTNVGEKAFKNNTFLREVTVENRSVSFADEFCEGSYQTVPITIKGYTGSTAEDFVTQYGKPDETTVRYVFSSLDACAHENTETVTVREPNCTETGLQQVICNDCGEVVREITTDALGHTWGDPTETFDNTEVNGHIYNSYQCSVCGETKEEVVHARNINVDPSSVNPEDINADDLDPSLMQSTVYVWVDGYYTTTVVRAATCTKAGLERYHCTVDGCDQTETHVVLAHHTVTSWTVTKPATCTEEGSRKGICDVCGEDVTETIKPTGHSYDKETPDEVWDDENDGHTHKLYICKNCGEEIQEYVHNEWKDGLYTATSTTYDNCQLPGVELDTCDICGARRTVEIPARGEHDFYETSRTEPNCTQRGRIYLACHNCQFTTVEYIDALGHDFVLDDENSTPATCTEAGKNVYKCARCSQLKNETVDALGHVAEEGTWVVDNEPDCTNTGTGHGFCSRCEQEYTDTIPALGHDYQDVETDLADSGKPGHVLAVPTCTRCNAREAGQIVHKEWIDGSYNITATTPATCTLAQTEVRQCTICNTIGTVQISPALGHQWAYTGSFSSSVLTNSETIGNLNIPNLPGNITIPDDNSEPVEIPFTGEVTAQGVQFRCLHCARTTVKPMDEIKALWSFDVVGEAPGRTAPVIHNEGEEDEYTEETDKTSYLDMNGDGIINGKDWAYIKQLYAQQQELIAQQEAEEGEE